MNQTSTSLSPVPLRPEDVWLLAAANEILLGKESRPQEPSPSFDWQYLLRQASLHALGPCLARYCEAHPGVVPEPVRESLKQELDRVRAYNFFLLQELARICEELGTAGIKVLAWKGPALATSVFPDPGLRQCADLDLLVSPAQLNDAVALLQQNGYHEQSVDTGGHTRNLERDFPKAVVELHSLVAQSYFSIPIQVDSLFASVTQIRSLTGVIPVPAPGTMLLLLCIHGSKHIWERLIWICDVILLLRAHPQLDWDLLWREADLLGVRRVVSLALLLADGLAPGSVPAVELAKCQQDTAAVVLARKAAAWMFLPQHDHSHALKRAWYLLEMRERLKDRWPLAIRYCGQLFTPGEADRAYVKLPAACSLFYYLVRPIRLLLKTLGGR